MAKTPSGWLGEAARGRLEPMSTHRVDHARVLSPSPVPALDTLPLLIRFG